MVVSSGETVLQEPESNMDLHVKTTEVQMVTCTSRTEPLVETADLDNKWIITVLWDVKGALEVSVCAN